VNRAGQPSGVLLPAIPLSHLSRIDSAGTILPLGTGPLFHAAFNPGDSTAVFYSTDYNVTPGGYRYGIDVIVVWPVTGPPMAALLDSLYFNVFITRDVGINEPDKHTGIRLYPNPCSDQLTIENKDGDPVKAVIIYDITGRILLSFTDQSSIHIKELAAGVYYADVYLSDKKRYFIKFIRQ